MPKILLAPTAFKGSMTPLEVCRALESGVENYMRATKKKIYIETSPLADGGDGTLEALLHAGGGRLISCGVVDALGQAKTTHWLKRECEAVVELSSCCGIADLKDLAPTRAGTYGLGMAVKAALEHPEVASVNVALGGSASTDGGIGALQALGARCFDADGAPFTACGGASLIKIAAIDLAPVKLLFNEKPVKLAVDVENPLLGPCGAARVFSPQKGATPEQTDELERAMEHFAHMVENNFSLKIKSRAGTGAAGGTAFGLACAGATICDGFTLVSQICSLPDKIQSADLVITGEGRIDATSNLGKVTGKLVALCRELNVPLLLVAGDVDDNASLPFETIVKAAPEKGRMASWQDVARAAQVGISKLLS